MKKIIVFGATGSIGRQVITQALSTGYQVTAFCRNKATLSHIKAANFQIKIGDVNNTQSIANAISEQDIVIITLGSGKNRKSTVRSVGTKNIIAVMKKNGSTRMICQTTLGTAESNNNLNFFWKHIMFGWFLKRIFLDHELQEEYVRKSGLDWTIVRPGAFTDAALTGNYQHGFDSTYRSLKLKISRADVADFILKQIHSDQYLFKSPGLSY